MIRLVAAEGLLLLLPFGVFAGLLLLQRRRVLAIESWSAHAVSLATIGLGLFLASFLYKGLIAERPMTGFQPTHMENGQVVPGRFR